MDILIIKKKKTIKLFDKKKSSITQDTKWTKL